MTTTIEDPTDQSASSVCKHSTRIARKDLYTFITLYTNTPGSSTTEHPQLRGTSLTSTQRNASVLLRIATRITPTIRTQMSSSSLQSVIPSRPSLQDLILATSAHETEGICCSFHLIKEESIQLRATQDANPKELVVRVDEVAKLTTGPGGQVDER